MLGIAASSSIAVEIGRRAQRGAMSVRNSAMPIETGTAMISAIAELTSVP